MVLAIGVLENTSVCLEINQETVFTIPYSSISFC